MSGIEIITGDVRDELRKLSDESVHCVVTSPPPYWGLRDYGVAGQIGLESSLGGHIDMMVEVFREVRRVLRKDGTLWLNYGDAYACAPNGRSAADTKAVGNDDRTFRDKPISTVGAIYSPQHEAGDRRGKSSDLGHRGQDAHTGRIVGVGVLKPKDRMLLPARVAIALQEDGWWVRDEIIWHKPNPMPISVKDRTTPAHEMIYLLTRSKKYHFDQEAILEPCSPNTHARISQNLAAQIGSYRANGGKKTGGPMKAVIRGSTRKLAEAGSGIASNDSYESALALKVDKRNPRSVWTVKPRGFKEAHFATFPPDLIRPCILAGCPVGGTVLDPFFGAGTTGLVAKELGRNCIGIELNPDYVAIAAKRIGYEHVKGWEIFA